MVKCGIDIGGTNIKFGLFFENRNPYYFRVKTPKEKEEIIPTIKRTIESKINLDEILGFTVAIPGVIKDDNVIYAPNTNILGLNIKKELSLALNNSNIIIENDANLQALAESKASNLSDMILISIGTGLGGGIIINNQIHNHNGFAGEIGHIKVHFGKNSRQCGCGKYGCAEAYVSCKAIVKEYNEINNTNINAKEIFDLEHQGDTLARNCINSTARYLAITIADIVAVLGIKNVRITGGLSNAGESFLRRVRYYYPRYSVSNMEEISIESATLKDKAGVTAAKYLL